MCGYWNKFKCYTAIIHKRHQRENEKRTDTMDFKSALKRLPTYEIFINQKALKTTKQRR